MNGYAPVGVSGAAPCTRFVRHCLATLTSLAVAILLIPSVGLGATPRVHAIVGARIVTSPSRVIENGTVVMRDGLITAVGAGIAVPADARIWDGTGLTVYPGLIDPFVVPKVKSERGSGSAALASESRGAAHELSTVTPERRVAEMAPLSDEQRESLRAAGFTLAQIIPGDGVIRGQSAAVGLGDGSLNDNLVRADAAQVVSIQSSGNFAAYPGSRQGGIALIRQTFMDAGWYRDAQSAHARHKGRVERPDFNLALDALQPAVTGGQRVLFRAPDMLAVLASANIAKEAGVEAYACGAGDGYKRAAAIRATGLSLVVPVNYPDAPDVSDPGDAIEVTTEVLRHWQSAPGNAAALASAGVPISLTANGLKKTKAFRTNVAKAIERGLDADAALAAVTIEPAKLLGLSDRLGTIAAGRIANLTVTTGDLFAKKSNVHAVWVDGNRYAVAEMPSTLEGEWAVSWGGAESVTLLVKGGRKTSVQVVAGDDTLKAEDIDYEPTRLTFNTTADGAATHYVVSLCRDRLCGTRAMATSGGNGSRRDLNGIRIPENEKPEDSKGDGKPDELVAIPVVMGSPEAWRMPRPEQPDALLIRNATIWTAGPQGTLEGADMLVRRGTITAIGVGLEAPRGAKIIDAAGAHVMPGIIDEHSHAAILGGVNECTNSNTSEVRIQDVVNSESINIYRQLAGGVTMMHMLHGSCNAIGGQCAAIKARWGATPDELLVKNMPPTIKFALGENVKGSNTTAGPRSQRYPRTRGGVEQVYRSEFKRAIDYRSAWQEFDSGKRKAPPRRDLQMDALVEILEGTRQVHCHSYRQDEILMLIRVADDFGFTVNTFTHILEGYKVADEMAKHGAAGSAFTDWWAYKFEVYDAIPYNGYLMWDRGITVAFNSDDAELARRLNTEAAKAVKYGGVPKNEAIKFVTLNPAKMLKLDDRVGSLEKGKEADFSIWNGVPLSPYSRCEQTWVDGRLYFDREADLVGRATLAAERVALIAKAKAADKGREGGGDGESPPTYMYLLDADLLGNDCGSDGEYWVDAERVQNGEVQR